MKKILSVMAVAAMMVGVLAGPAAAADYLGTFTGTANVGRTFSTACTSSGTGVVDGNGLYVPAWDDGAGTYSLSTTLSVAGGGTGSLKVCGDLGAGSVTSLGASCGSSQGSNGQGEAVLGGNTVSLSDVGWDQSVGGTLLVSGDAGTGTDNLTAVVQAQGASECADVLGDGATQFAVAGLFQATGV